VLGIAGLVLTVLWVVACAWFSAQLAGVGHGNPALWAADRDHTGRWNSGATGWALLFGIPTALVGAAIVVVAVRTTQQREWTDPLARSLSRARDLREMTEKYARKDAQRLRSEHAGIGLPLGIAVLTQQKLFGLYEWSQVWIMGTRAGKTRTVAIPQIMTHQGPVVTTSNKRDVVDRTRGGRSELGPVLINDPQRIAKQRATWFWDVIKFVTSIERAHKVVEVWSAARSTADMAGLDPYFEPEGRKLTATLLVAARLGDQTVERLPDWTTGQAPAPGVPDPCSFLEAAGFSKMAGDIRDYLSLDDGQRDGIYGTARSYLGFLDDPRYVRWISPNPVAGQGRIGQAMTSVLGDRREEFDPDAFVRSNGTLYLLSKEGAGSARAITAALTMAVYTAAEDYAEASGDRVPTPILFMLDEAANVCRWPELPFLYSHAGGKGIILVTILQSAKQGEKAWGVTEFAMMFGAANVSVVGRGINDAEHLAALAQLTGDRQLADSSRSVGSRGHRQTSHSNTKERIFDEADLRAMPRGRAILFTSGNRPILLALQDFSTYEWNWKCTESRQIFGPGGAEAEPDDDVDQLRPLSAEEMATWSAVADAAAAVEVPDEVAITSGGEDDSELVRVDVQELLKNGIDDMSPYAQRRLAAAGRPRS